ncbi:MAG: DUF6261 family protein [Prevotella sp.]|nr:DUF6261 family protein [Prevotella sp.]
MERIKNMSLHPLRVEEDFGFQKLVVAETEKLPLADSQPGHTTGLTATVEAFKQAYRKFDDALKASATVPAAKKAAEKDAQRDEAWRTMREYAKAAMAFPTPVVAETAAEVYALFRKYGDLATLPQTEETGRLHNLLQELSAIDSGRMTGANFTPLLDHLRQCEDEYLAAAGERAAQEGAVEVGIIKLSRVAADAACRTLADTVNALVIVNGPESYKPFIDSVNAYIDRMKTVLAARRTVNAKKPSAAKGGKSQTGLHAEELKRIKTMIAEYEQSSHLTPGIVLFTGLAAGKDATRAYQVYLSDQPGDLFWLTVKDGRLTETELKPEPGQPGGLPTEKIK